MFVSEIIPNLWVCDYDIITSNYFNNRNIGLYVHVYSFQEGEEFVKLNLKKRIGYNQELIGIKIKELEERMCYSQNSLVQRQIMRYSKDFAELIYNNINLIQNTLKYKRGVVLFSKHAIQKAAIIAAAYLISKGKIDVDTSIKIMNSKEPLFFKSSENDDITIVLYKHSLEYIASLV